MREINIGFYFFPVFALNAFSILIFATVLFKFGVNTPFDKADGQHLSNFDATSHI